MGLAAFSGDLPAMEDVTTARNYLTEGEKVPVHLQMTLTIREPAEYSNIGINQLAGIRQGIPVGCTAAQPPVTCLF